MLSVSLHVHARSGSKIRYAQGCFVGEVSDFPCLYGHVYCMDTVQGRSGGFSCFTRMHKPSELAAVP